MRTTKRFTPTVLARFLREQRGRGVHADYVGFHRVTRGDPASLGRSHILQWRNRLRDFLSDGELDQQYFATMLDSVDDCLEQYRLDLEDAPHPLAAYHDRDAIQLYPGTVKLAEDLQIKHPMVRGEGTTAQWHPSTDLVLVFRDASHVRTMLAIAFKLEGWQLNRRTVELLSLEKEYWTRRNVPWLLITPAQYEQSVILTLRRTAPWALSSEVLPAQKLAAAEVATELDGRSLTVILNELAIVLNSVEVAQRALWQAIWTGVLPVDLRRGWRPHLPFQRLDLDAFRGLNPIAARRSAWLT